MKTSNYQLTSILILEPGLGVQHLVITLHQLLVQLHQLPTYEKNSKIFTQLSCRIQETIHQKILLAEIFCNCTISVLLGVGIQNKHVLVLDFHHCIQHQVFLKYLINQTTNTDILSKLPKQIWVIKHKLCQISLVTPHFHGENKLTSTFISR